MRITGDLHIGNGRDVFEQPPSRRAFSDRARELPDRKVTLASRGRAPNRRVVLTRRAGNDTIEAPSGRKKLVNVSAENLVRAAHDTEALGFETAAEKINSREERQHQRRPRPFVDRGVSGMMHRWNEGPGP